MSLRFAVTAWNSSEERAARLPGALWILPYLLYCLCLF